MLRNFSDTFFSVINKSYIFSLNAIYYCLPFAYFLLLEAWYLGFPDKSPTDISPTDSSPADSSPTDISPTRHIPDGHFPDQTHPRRTLPRPDTSPTNTSPTRHIPDGHFPDQTNARQIFYWVDASHNGYFPDQLNTSNNLKYLQKYIVRDNFGNIHAVEI